MFFLEKICCCGTMLSLKRVLPKLQKNVGANGNLSGTLVN